MLVLTEENEYKGRYLSHSAPLLNVSESRKKSPRITRIEAASIKNKGNYSECICYRAITQYVK